MKEESLISIINRTLEGLYYSALMDTQSIDRANSDIEKFLCEQDKSHDNAFVNNGLDNNVDFYKRISILYLCTKVYVSEIHNIDMELPFDTTEEIYQFLDKATPKSLLIKYYNDPKFRQVITSYGIITICANKGVTNYKHLQSLKSTNKINQVMNLMPYFLLEYADQVEIDTQDLIIDDVVELYVSNIRKIKDDLSRENSKLEGEQDESEKDEQLSLDDMSEEEKESLKENMKYAEEEAKQQVEETMNQLMESIKDSIINRYGDKNFNKRIGFIIGSVYSSLVRTPSLAENEKILKDYLENNNVNLNAAVNEFLNNEEFSHIVLEVFISDNLLKPFGNRKFTERQVELKGKQYVKTMKKFDTYYKEN